MQLVLVVLISLCCWSEKVNANRNLTSTQCRKNMFEEWHNTNTFGSYKLKDEDWKYLQDIDIGERADGSPRVRKECRTLPPAELKRLFEAFKWLFRNRYRVFMSQHRFSQSPGAHFGPCFPSWHRQFLWSLEQALREFDPSVTLCYWDSSLDSSLPDASHSCLWTAEFFGECEGYVRTGFAANQRAFPDDCASTWPTLFRSCGGNSLLFNQRKVNDLLRSAASADSFAEFLSPYTSSTLENYHGDCHGFVGGHMGSISCAVTDPIFFFHHCFIDYLWERCRRSQRTDREHDYPRDRGVPRFHRATDTMLPFSGNCEDGLSYSYIPGRYSYQQSPGSCTTDAQCGGSALWCNSGRCEACVGPNGQMGDDWPHRACRIYSGCRRAENVDGICTCVRR